MKLLFAIIYGLFTLTAFATEDFCNGRSTCRTGYIPLLKSGTFHARGIGSTCQQAMDNSQTLFLRTYGDMSCGLISGPWVYSCSQIGQKKYVAWTKCTPDSGPARSAPRSRCVMIQGQLICR